jgi:AmmeMemoRadiSam system protein A
MGEKQIIINTDELDDELRKDGASFVTLYRNHQLRGCIGTLVAHQALFKDVAEHAVAAGTQDYRFPPVHRDELISLHYEISILSPLTPLSYVDSTDLLAQIKPGVHGVVLVSKTQRATFLPQVWQNIPETEKFLTQLCIKMGAAPEAWRNQKFDVSVYEVQEFADV